MFNDANKLRRLKDDDVGAIYYGFSRGYYSYVITILEGKEKNEYSMNFYITKKNKVIQSDDCTSYAYRDPIIASRYIEEASPQRIGKGEAFP
ncbi:hypothetical protein [Pluralibacter gergoviae]|nr:hypothetical protein [Pluralibacter gergoviae]MBL3695418.1 hypothetical protein [Pluralibacter gergoviae]